MRSKSYSPYKDQHDDDHDSENYLSKFKGCSVEIYPTVNFEKAFRRFKRKVSRDGIIQEVKDRMYHEKKSDKKRRLRNRAILNEQRSFED